MESTKKILHKIGILCMGIIMTFGISIFSYGYKTQGALNSDNKKISEKVSLQATTDRKDGLITVNGEVDSEKVSDVTMHAYLIATYSNQGDIVITDEFSGYDFTLDENTSESEISDIAANINNNIRNDGINSIKTAIMKDGSAVMDGLSEGVYLINGDNFTVGNNTYSVTPIIVELIIDDSGEMKLTINAKFVYNSTSYKVEKIWKNDGSLSHESIEIELLKDGEVYETVTLNDANNWRYTWDTVDKDANWSVREVSVPKYYGVSYRNEGSDFVVVNTYTPPEEEETTVTEETTEETSEETTEEETKKKKKKSHNSTEETTDDYGENTGGRERDREGGGDSEKLPQTGLLWWPVIVLMIFGILLLSVGIKIYKDEK